MNSRRIALVVAVPVVIAIGMSIAWYAMQPHTAAQQLEHARGLEAASAAKIAALRANPSPSAKAEAERLLNQSLDEYAKVGRKYAGTPEVEDADYRALQIRDENSTDPKQRIALIAEFVKHHPKSPHVTDLEWRTATLTHQEVRALLDAIKLYEAFAKNHPNDDRAAEALFRVGSIYEQIREFGAAVGAYQRVAKEFPRSKFADEAQFRTGSLLADKMERKSEAAEAFAKLEAEKPGSRFAAAAGSERKKLAAAAAKSGGEKYSDDYYGGVREVEPYDRMAEELRSPLMKRLRTQPLDLVHEVVRTEMAPADHAVTASVSMTASVLGATSPTLVLQLGSPLEVASLRVDGKPARFERQDNFLLVDTGGGGFSRGSTVTLDLEYHGVNRDTWGGDIITTASSYLFSRNFLPFLGLGDTFTADISVRVPGGYTAVTQGDALGRTESRGTVEFRFRQSQPVYHYVLAVAPYAVRAGNAPRRSGGPPVHMAIHLFPETPAAFFDGYLREIPPILDFFESKLGAYPYPKLAVARVNYFPGGLGTPGLILMGSRTFETTGIPAAFLAHEIAHAWFGNAVGLDLGDDSIPWLSEGFAQYWDALYLEHAKGRDVFVRHMRSLAENYYSAVSQVADKPIRGTLWGDPMYASLAYDKGAFVLHGLRGFLGDEKFFRLMGDYARENAGRNARVADFIRCAERIHGASLDWFFGQWLDRTGIPRLRLDAARLVNSGAGKHEIQVVISQVGKPFRIPVELEIETTDGRERHQTELRDETTTVGIATRGKPRNIVLDPDYWVLKHPRREEWEKPVGEK